MPEETAECVRGGAPTGGGQRRADLLAERRLSVAAGCVLLPVVVVTGGRSGLPPVVAGHVVPGWALRGALLVASLVPGLSSRLVGRRTTEAAASGARGCRPGRPFTQLSQLIPAPSTAGVPI
ncbi:MAG: hypothetical protein JWM15_2794 [Cryptosporangiaceae bacterium]|nr:hypothetical protein [Cryptosporangiaceae bacterium]